MAGKRKEFARAARVEQAWDRVGGYRQGPRTAAPPSPKFARALEEEYASRRRGSRSRRRGGSR